jgi:hypothetical protein
MGEKRKGVERTDEDTPFDGELLDDDDGSPLIVSGNLGETDGDLESGNTDRYRSRYDRR